MLSTQRLRALLLGVVLVSCAVSAADAAPPSADRSADAVPAAAPTPLDASKRTEMQNALATRLGGKAEDYLLSPLPGTDLIEVFSRENSRVVYVDRSVRLVFLGTLFDTGSKTNLTAARQHELNRIPLSSLPSDRVIRIVKGTGKPEFAAFEDPDCPFCRAMEASLDKLDNYTLYVLLLPLTDLHPNAAKVAKAIWCAENPSAAWHSYLTEQKVPAERECNTPIAELAKLANQHLIQGTPTLLMPDGEIVEGMPDLEALKQSLGAIQ